jgi:hypothetical protein
MDTQRSAGIFRISQSRSLPSKIRAAFGPCIGLSGRVLEIAAQGILSRAISVSSPKRNPAPSPSALRTAMAAPARPAHGTIESARRERLGLRVQPDSSREHRPGEGNEQKWRRPNQTRIASTAIQMLLLDGLEDLGE